MKPTYKEQERIAYISGDTEKAKLIAEIIDLQDEICSNEDEYTND